MLREVEIEPTRITVYDAHWSTNTHLCPVILFTIFTDIFFN